MKLTIPNKKWGLLILGVFILQAQNVDATLDLEPKIVLLGAQEGIVQRRAPLPPGGPAVLLGPPPDAAAQAATLYLTAYTTEPTAATPTTEKNLAEPESKTAKYIKAEDNLQKLTTVNHQFYNSSFVGNRTYFDEHWRNITEAKFEVQPILSNGYRKAKKLKLSFEFPFYGYPLQNISVTTGGFISTVKEVHNWLAAMQYIAPLMANFDTTITNDSKVKIYDDGEKFTVLWEKVTLQEDEDKKFTFAVTLYKNGEIVFAYKNVPMPVQQIKDKEHPVKIGVSDALKTERFNFYRKRKTMYEYHRISLMDHEIESGTLIRLVALPTCHQYSTCDTCVNHQTALNCSWCDAIQMCSSANDRNLQYFKIGQCEQSNTAEVGKCPAPAQNVSGEDPEDGDQLGPTSATADGDAKPVEGQQRVKRSAPMSPGGATVAAGRPASAAPTATVLLPSTTSTTVATTANSTNKQNVTNAATAVTRVPLLGENGTGIRINVTNKPRVSDPILDNGNFAEQVFETPEKIKAEHNLQNLTIDSHEFYNSSFVGNRTFFDQYWRNITEAKFEVHPKLSDSHRWATTLKPSFEFPFYGHPLQNITIATGGFIYTGDQVHNWLAATQYIAPLMANFDTRITNDSFVKLYDDGERFTVLWENVTLQEDKDKKFTFAVTLYKNGDIFFAYKEIPMPVQQINDKEHPVKVGISDAYLTDKVLFYVRRKTIYEYHRVSFTNHEIESGTLIRLVALPTCHQYSTCDTCVNHQTAFNCSWCEAIQKCSSGTDRNKQDWMIRHCERSTIVEASRCPARPKNDTGVYRTDGGQPGQTSVIAASADSPAVQKTVQPSGAADAGTAAAAGVGATGSGTAGGAAAAFVSLTLIAAVGAWLFYAFKNPHTRSGQMLIKYRPSQWSWKRGEARYTAATIHM